MNKKKKKSIPQMKCPGCQRTIPIPKISSAFQIHCSICGQKFNYEKQKETDYYRIL